MNAALSLLQKRAELQHTNSHAAKTHHRHCKEEHQERVMRQHETKAVNKKSSDATKSRASIPRYKQVEVESAQLEDGVVGTQARVAKKQEGKQLCGELVVSSVVKDLGEDRQIW